MSLGFSVPCDSSLVGLIVVSLNVQHHMPREHSGRHAEANYIDYGIGHFGN